MVTRKRLNVTLYVHCISCLDVKIGDDYIQLLLDFKEFEHTLQCDDVFNDAVRSSDYGHVTSNGL